MLFIRPKSNSDEENLHSKVTPQTVEQIAQHLKTIEEATKLINTKKFTSYPMRFSNICNTIFSIATTCLAFYKLAQDIQQTNMTAEAKLVVLSDVWRNTNATMGREPVRCDQVFSSAHSIDEVTFDCDPEVVPHYYGESRIPKTIDNLDNCYKIEDDYCRIKTAANNHTAIQKTFVSLLAIGLTLYLIAAVAMHIKFKYMPKTLQDILGPEDFNKLQTLCRDIRIDINPNSSISNTLSSLAYAHKDLNRYKNNPNSLAETEQTFRSKYGAI